MLSRSMRLIPMLSSVMTPDLVGNHGGVSAGLKIRCRNVGIQRVEFVDGRYWIKESACKLMPVTMRLSVRLTDIIQEECHDNHEHRLVVFDVLWECCAHVIPVARVDQYISILPSCAMSHGMGVYGAVGGNDI